MPEIYVSTDIEADGPIPGPYSMLSFGSAAYSADGTLVSSYSANLEPLPGAAQHPKTMEEFWKKYPEAWAACRENPRPPEEVMPEFVDWVKALPGQPVFVAWPVGFDFTFMYWYLIKFAGSSPFGHSALDIRSYWMGMDNKDFRQTGARHLPKDWLDKSGKRHVALDDAMRQGKLFCRMLEENRSRRTDPVFSGRPKR